MSHNKRVALRDPQAPKRFGERLSTLMKRARISQSELGEYLGGYRQDSISRICSGKFTTIPIDVAEGLVTWCIAEGFSSVWLWTGRGSELVAATEISPYDVEWLVNASRDELAGELAVLVCQEAEIKGQLQALNDPARRRAIAGASSEPVRPTAPPSPAFRIAEIAEAGYREIAGEDVPVDGADSYTPIINAAAAGHGIDTDQADSYAPGWAESFVRHSNPDGTLFAVRVTGESMLPDLRDGDLLIVDPARPAVKGRPAVVVYQIDHTRLSAVKLWQPKRNTIVLASTNDAYRDIELDKAQILEAWGISAHLPKVRRESK